jgi:hypothetical protein
MHCASLSNGRPMAPVCEWPEDPHATTTAAQIRAADAVTVVAHVRHGAGAETVQNTRGSTPRRLTATSQSSSRNHGEPRTPAISHASTRLPLRRRHGSGRGAAALAVPRPKWEP